MMRALNSSLVVPTTAGKIIIPSGSEGGYHASGDVLTQTVDGVDLNQLWDEFQETVQMHNEERQRLITLLTFSVSEPTEAVSQFGSADFEKASEFGEPRGIRPTTQQFFLGYDFDWYDIAARFTWKYLAEALASQIEAVNNMVLEADNRLMFRKVMEAVFDNRTRSANINQQAYSVYPFYNGDGTTPPTYKNKTFASGHNHYMVSGAADVDPGDLVDLARNITEHGYGDGPGPTLILLVNEQEGDAIQTWRRGETYGGVVSPHDFIPVSQDLTTILAPGEAVVGGLPPNNVRGLDVMGRYGKFLVVKENYIPAGYMLAIVSDGDDSINNPVGIREHQNAGLRGLRLIQGRSANYPLVDSYYGRALGTGVRHRGAAAVMQIKASGTYDRPAEYERT